MKPRLKTRVIAAAIVLYGAVVALPARSADVDWKYYGGASVEGFSQCFYDANGVQRPPDGHVRVWTKCLAQADLDKVDIQKDYHGQILEDLTTKVSKSYIPPLGSVEKLDMAQVLTITQYEEMADIGVMNPQSSIFYEFNCHEKMVRELSIHIETETKKIAKDSPTEWHYLPPEGIGADLAELLCPLE